MACVKVELLRQNRKAGVTLSFSDFLYSFLPSTIVVGGLSCLFHREPKKILAQSPKEMPNSSESLEFAMTYSKFHRSLCVTDEKQRIKILEQTATNQAC